MKKYLFITIIILLSIIVAGGYYIKYLQSEHERIKTNQKVLLNNMVQYYKTKSGLLAASNKTLTLTISELKQSESKLLDTIKSMKIKVRDVLSITSITLEVKKESDPIPLVNSIYNGKPAKVYSYKDKYLSLTGIIQNDSIRPAVNTIVPIFPVVHEVPRYLFWKIIRIRPKEVDLTTYSPNPYVTIISQERVEIKRK
jgi:hypothetical protein